MKKNPSDIGKCDGPSLLQPAYRRFRFGHQTSNRDAGGGPKPDHGTSETDSVGEESPIIVSLLYGERCQRNIVEHGRDEAESERCLPTWRRQGFDRHERRCGDKSYQKQRTACGVGKDGPIRPRDWAAQEKGQPRPQARSGGPCPEHGRRGDVPRHWPRSPTRAQ